MDEGFDLGRPVYTPSEVGRLYSLYVRKVSYATVLEWIKIFHATRGKEGIEAHRSPRGRYTIAADEVERILLQAGAKKREKKEHEGPGADRQS